VPFSSQTAIFDLPEFLIFQIAIGQSNVYNQENIIFPKKPNLSNIARKPGRSERWKYGQWQGGKQRVFE
jgi:hypothetical protein